jgi:hypothetical protein
MDVAMVLRQSVAEPVEIGRDLLSQLQARPELP